jgi:DNA polymerase-3 subunit epsilon
MRATTELFLQLDKRNEDLMPVIAPQGKTRMPARILCRPELLGNDELAGMQTIRKTIPDFDDTGFSNSQLSYADALYGAMSDFSITNTETEYLSEWAQAVGVSEEERLEVHQDYLNQLVVAANRDRSISEQEKKAIESAALALAIRPPLFFTSKQTSFQLVDGVRVCFTGTAKGLDGNILTKDELAQIAVQKGLIPVASVTKKTCELVVTADLSSMSRKAQLARKYGISVISVTDFLNSK